MERSQAAQCLTEEDGSPTAERTFRRMLHAGQKVRDSSNYIQSVINPQSVFQSD